MKKKITICDRCGKEITKSTLNEDEHIKIRMVCYTIDIKINILEHLEKDLCQECLDLIRENFPTRKELKERFKNVKLPGEDKKKFRGMLSMFRNTKSLLCEEVGIKVPKKEMD